MTFKSNTLANFVGQGYAIGIALIILPLYLRELGAEAYGLIGFFVVLQSLLRLLDMGLSPALGRELAHAAGLSSAVSSEMTGLVRVIERLFLLLALGAALMIWHLSSFIATHWLHTQSLPVGVVSQCITLMGLATSLRLFSSVYSSGIQGLEHQVWLNSANGVVATFRYVGAWSLLHWITHDPRYFFVYELGVSLGETGLLYYGLHRLLPAAKEGKSTFTWAPLAKILPFAGGVAYAAFVWIVLTQLNNLVLSNVLPLWKYGYYALVALIANGLMSLGGPVSTAVLPRMTSLFAQGSFDSMMLLYRKASQLVAVLMLPICALVASLPREVIFGWTGDYRAAQWGAPVLMWLALGNGLLTLGAFQYYLQYAHGKVKLHVWNSTINVLIQAPLIIFAAYHYGAYGAALTWFVLRAVSFMVWPTIVHRLYAPGLHKTWLLHDIGPILAVTGASALLAHSLANPLAHAGRVEVLTVLSCVGLAMLVVTVLASWACRPYLFKAIAWAATAHG